MFSLNVHQNLMHIDRNAHLQTIWDSHTNLYVFKLNLTNLWRVKKGRAIFYFWMNCQFSEKCTQRLFYSIPEYFPAAVFQFGSFKWCLKDGLASTHCSNSRRWYLMVMVFFRSGTLRWRHHRSRFAAQVWNVECESSRKCPGSRKSESSRKSCSEANRISTTTPVKKDRPAGTTTTTKEATAKATTVAGTATATATVRFTDGNQLWGLSLTISSSLLAFALILKLRIFVLILSERKIVACLLEQYPKRLAW